MLGPRRSEVSLTTVVGWNASATLPAGAGPSAGTVRVWDLAATAPPRVLTGHDDPVEALAISADGQTAISGGVSAVWVWDLAATAPPRVLTGHDGPVHAVAISADAQTAISGGEDDTVRVWDLAGTAPPRVLAGHDGPVHAVAISADAQTAISGGDDNTMRVWDLADGQERARWIADERVLAVAFNAGILVAGDMVGQVHALQLKLPAAAPA